MTRRILCELLEIQMAQNDLLRRIAGVEAACSRARSDQFSTGRSRLLQATDEETLKRLDDQREANQRRLRALLDELRRGNVPCVPD